MIFVGLNGEFVSALSSPINKEVAFAVPFPPLLFVYQLREKRKEELLVLLK